MANSITGFQLAQQGVNLASTTPTLASLTQEVLSKPTVFQEGGAKAAAQKAPIFRYPLENILEDYSDYLKIDAYEYEPPGVGDVGESFNFSIPTSDTSYQSLSTKTVVGTVILPIPQKIPNNSQSAKWGEGNLNPITAAGIGVAQETIKDGVEGLAKGVSSFVGKVAGASQTGLGQKTIQTFFATKGVEQLLGQDGDLFGEILARETGAVINENIELLFRGIALRGSFDLSFDLAPRDEKEAQEIKKMVFFLKKQMSPRKGTQSGAAGGLFLTAPNVFKVQYMSGKKEHPYLNRYKICALNNLNLDFTASNTHATYADGTPVHMSLSLTFQELTPIYFEDYESPEASFGVGY